MNISFFFTWPVGLWWLYLVSLLHVLSDVNACASVQYYPVLSGTEQEFSKRLLNWNNTREEDLEEGEIASVWVDPKGLCGRCSIYHRSEWWFCRGRTFQITLFILSVLQLDCASYILNEWILKDGQESGGLSCTWRQDIPDWGHSMDVNRCSSCWKSNKLIRVQESSRSRGKCKLGILCGSLKGFQCCRRPGFSLWVGKIPWRREWQPTPVFLPGESQGQKSLVGYSSWDHKESDMTEQLTVLEWGVCT